LKYISNEVVGKWENHSEGFVKSPKNALYKF